MFSLIFQVPVVNSRFAEMLASNPSDYVTAPVIAAPIVLPKEKKKRKAVSDDGRKIKRTAKNREPKPPPAPLSPFTIRMNVRTARHDIRRGLEFNEALQNVDRSNPVSEKAGVDAARVALFADIRRVHNENMAGMDQFWWY